MSAIHDLTFKVGDEPWDVMTAAVSKQVMQAQRSRLGNAPGKHELTPDAVLKAVFAFQHQDSCALFSHRSGKRGTGQAPTNRDQIVIHGASLPPNSRRSSPKRRLVRRRSRRLASEG
jgi:hypothetical protein